MATHHGLDIDGYAEVLAALARWPDRKAEVLRLLRLSEARWEAAAALFVADLGAERASGGQVLAQRVDAVRVATRSQLDMQHAALADLPRLLKKPEPALDDDLEHTVDMGSEGEQKGEVMAPIVAAPSITIQHVGARTLDAPSGPFVPAATPFQISEEEIERYAALTADLAACPTRRDAVLVKHGVKDVDALAQLERLWQVRLQNDVRLRMHWEGLHKSLLSFVERERARGVERCP